MEQQSVFKTAVIMTAITTAFTIKAPGQTPASENTAMKYMADTTYVTGKSVTNPIYHTAEDATIKALCDYVLFIHQYDSVNLGLGISGNQNAVPVFTAQKVIGSSNITDTAATHKATIADTLYLPAVPNAIDPDSVLVWGYHSHKVRKAAPPSATGPVTVTWPGNVYGLNTVSVPYGGTGITSYSLAGAIPYSTGSVTMTYLPLGAVNSVLEVLPGTGLPGWIPLSSVVVSSVTAVSGADINFTNVNQTSTPVITATLTTVNSSPGSYGSASVVPVFSVTATGRVVAVTATPVSIPYSSVTGISPAYIGTVAVNAAPGSYGSASVVPVFSVGPTGQVTTVTATPISITASQINNLPASLWAVGGNSLTATGNIGTTSNNGVNYMTDGIIHDSVTTYGQHYFVNEQGYNSGYEAVAAFGNNSSIGVQQTQRVWIGVGTGGAFSANTAFVSFGSTYSNGTVLTGGGVQGDNYFQFRSTGSNGSMIYGGGTGAALCNVCFGIGQNVSDVSTSGTVTNVGSGYYSTGYQTFNPTSGSAQYFAFGDVGIYAPSVSCTGQYASFSNAQVTGTLTPDYAGVYLTNNSGYQVYAKGAAASYFGGNIAYAAPTTTTTTDSIVVMENGIVKKTNIINANTVQQSVPSVPGTGNYTITGGGQFIELPTPTGNYNLVLPTATTGMRLDIINLNTSGAYQWTFTNGTVKSSSSATITTLSNATSYSLVFDGTNWQQH